MSESTLKQLTNDQIIDAAVPGELTEAQVEELDPKIARLAERGVEGEFTRTLNMKLFGHSGVIVPLMRRRELFRERAMTERHVQSKAKHAGSDERPTGALLIHFSRLCKRLCSDSYLPSTKFGRHASLMRQS